MSSFNNKVPRSWNIVAIWGKVWYLLNIYLKYPILLVFFKQCFKYQMDFQSLSNILRIYSPKIGKTIQLFMCETSSSQRP